MTLKIQKAAVIGSGVMGSGIAAHLANCGISTLLLDVVMPDLERITKARPAHLYDAKDIRWVTPGLLDKHLEKLRECDWIIEAIVEKLDVKKQLYAKIAPYISEQAWVSSNTSGLPLAAMQFRDKFCITHFFNPPRYLKLVEMVGEAPELARFIMEKLGKGVVQAKDTPNFIANRIGVYHIYDILHQAVAHHWAPEVVDKVMGPATLHPKSAAYRTADLVGIDTLSLVAKTSHDGCPRDECREVFRNPEFLNKMIAKGLLGSKAKSGFYKKEGPNILSIDFQTLEYVPQVKFRADSLGKIREMNDPVEKLRTVVFADDEAGKIAWPLISNVLVYAANRIPEIAETPEEIDKAMRWGFNWELGPFQMWDALGVSEVAHRLESEGREIPKLVQSVLKNGGRFYPNPKKTFLQSAQSKNKTIEKNLGGSLVDLGDGIFCCEFHSKMNAIDEDVIQMINVSLARVEKEGLGLVIANEGENFSVGANLMLILMTAQQRDWKQLDWIVRQFQNTMQAIRFCKKPVVAAPFGFTFGGGCEVCLSAAHVLAAAETYIGLVEAGVGILPAGGGCKNMILRWEEKLKGQFNPKNRVWFSPEDGGPFPKVQHAFETIAMAKVATSAKEAQNFALLSERDGFVIDKERLIEVAKQKCLEMISDFKPVEPVLKIQLPGHGGKMALVSGAEAFLMKGLISEHDLKIATQIAHVLSGGDRPSVHVTDEQHLLDLEREAFLSLCGEEKSLERMQHMLLKGKPLRN